MPVLRLTVQAQPNARTSALVACTRTGPDSAALQVKIGAPPVEGAANDELVAFLAKRWKLPRGAFTLKLGQGGRQKLVLVTAAADRLALLLAELDGPASGG